jgi:hypothetical protein
LSFTYGLRRGLRSYTASWLLRFVRINLRVGDAKLKRLKRKIAAEP